MMLNLYIPNKLFLIYLDCISLKITCKVKFFEEVNMTDDVEVELIFNHHKAEVIIKLID